MPTRKLNVFWLLVFACTMPLGVVFSTQLARSSFERVKLRDQTITVKGYAEQAITADRAEWSASIVVRDADRTQAYAQLTGDRSQVLAFLASHGFADADVELMPVNIDAVHKLDARGEATNEIERYDLAQSFQIVSPDVRRIAAVAREASRLIGEGVELNARNPRYLYTQLDAMKLKMLAEATRNAHDRADALVVNSNGTLGEVRSASQGVFQITPAFSTEVSDSGYNDTASIDKSIKAVVTVEYAIR